MFSYTLKPWNHLVFLNMTDIHTQIHTQMFKELYNTIWLSVVENSIKSKPSSVACIGPM